jgi:hypothetical protein
MSQFIRLVFNLCLIGFLSACLRSETLQPEPSDFDLDTAAPKCPGLKVAEARPGPSIYLEWAEASDVVTETSKIIYSVFMKYGGQPYDPISPETIKVGATSALIDGVQLGQTYTLYVTCKDQKGNVAPTGPTNEKNVVIQDTTPPTSPNPVAVTNANYTSLLITWNTADDGQGGTTSSQMKYKLYRGGSSPVSTSGSPFVNLTGVTSYTNENLTPGTTYYYTIVAEDLAGNVSAPSNEASGTTLSDVTPPSFTPAMNVTNVETNSITLNWSAGSDNVTSPSQLKYRMYRCVGSTTCDPYSSPFVAEVTPGLSPSYENTALVANSVYVFGVRAVDSSGNSSTNTDRLVANTSYSSTGTFDFYPTPQEVGILFGESVAVANVVGPADGFTDLIVGAPNASEPGKELVQTGCIYIFPGTAAGVFSSTPSQSICQPGASANGANNRNFGTSMVAGDIDGNGTSDLVVGSPQQNAMFILKTTNSGGVLSFPSSTNSIVRSAGANGFAMGLCLANSDNTGPMDIVATSPFENCASGCGGFTGTGNVLIYNLVSSALPSDTPSTIFSPTNSLLSEGYVLQNSERTAWSCASGKFDPSNPTQDVLVVGSGYVDHDGNASANDGVIAFYRKTGANNWVFQNSLRAFETNPPQFRDSLWGYSLASVEVDGSGAPELFVGAPADNSAGGSTSGNLASGAVYGYSVTTSAGQFMLADLGTYYYGGSDQNANWAGTGIAAANIWGHATDRQDLVIGAAWDDRQNIAAATSIDIGDVFTYRNSNGTIASAIQQKNFDISSVNARINNGFGISLCKGDVNNDGYADVMTGSTGQSYDPTSMTTATSQGMLYVYHGRSNGEIDFANPNQLIFGPGNQASALFGRACEVMDYNGDGWQDLLVSSPWRDVGDRFDRGVVYVYYGSEDSILLSTPSATLNPPIVQLNQNWAESYPYFGFSLAKGDIDGNGHSDLIVGSPYFDSGGTDTGGVWVFWADANGAIQPSIYTLLLPPFGNQGSLGNPHLANPQMVGGRVAIRIMSRTANVVSVDTWPTGHGLLAGMFVTISNAMDSSFNGTFQVASAPNTTTFTFNQTAANAKALLITAMSRSANIVTVDTGSQGIQAGNHGLSVGESVTINVPTTSFNGTFTIASVPSATRFTFAQVGANEAATLNGVTFLEQQSSGGTVTAISRSSNLVTVTTSEAHGVCTSCQVGIWGSTSPSGSTINSRWPGSIGGSHTILGGDGSTQFRFNQGYGANETLGVSAQTFYRRYVQWSGEFGFSVEAFPTVPGSTGMDVIVCARAYDTRNEEIASNVGQLTDIGTCYVFEGAINRFGAPQTNFVMSEPRNEIRFPNALTNQVSNSYFFGSAMDRGDWDADGRDDLVICANRMPRLVNPPEPNAGACFAFLGRKGGVASEFESGANGLPGSWGSGGFETVTGYRPNCPTCDSPRLTPVADDVYYQSNLKVEAGITEFGLSVLLQDVNNNGRADLMIGEPNSDNAAIGSPLNLGRDSGRVHGNRGGF